MTEAFLITVQVQKDSAMHKLFGAPNTVRSFKQAGALVKVAALAQRGVVSPHVNVLDGIVVTGIM